MAIINYADLIDAVMNHPLYQAWQLDVDADHTLCIRFPAKDGKVKFSKLYAASTGHEVSIYRNAEGKLVEISIH